MTLVEVLVAMLLLAVVGSIIAGVVISSLKLTRTTTSGIEGQSELNDAVSRITRDIAAADPILWTSTTTGWAKNTPAADELWVQSVVNDRCTRVRYFVAGSGTTKTLQSETFAYPDAECPDPRRPDTTVTGNLKTLVRNLKTTSDTGAEVPVFTYYNKANAALSAPVSRANTPKIARVKIDVGSFVRERDKGVRLATSVAPRSMESPLITNIPPPDCAQANLRVVSNGQDPAAPVVSWSATDNARTFVLNRTAPVAATWPSTTLNPHTITDTAMRGRWGVGVTYTLDIDGPGGSVTCGPVSLTPPDPALLGVPNITVEVNPDTSTGPATVNSSTVAISWPAVNRATGYRIWRRPIDANNPGLTPTSTWTEQAYTTATSWSQTPGWDLGFEYTVVAESTNYTPTIYSGSNSGAPYTIADPANNTAVQKAKAVTHTSNTTLTGSATNYRVNTLNWQQYTGATVDGYAVFRRSTGTSNWGAPIWTTTNTATTTYTDNTAPLDSYYDYLVTTYNNGPRGTRYPNLTTRYYGSPSNTVSILQYPSIPANQTARGTDLSSNPDGTNSISWSAVPYASSYEVWEADSNGGTATSTRTGITGTSTTDTGNPRGTRNYYMAIACNPTGCSENKPNASLRAHVPAYQRPVAATVSATQTPTLVLNDIAFSYTRTGDAGEASDKFCVSGNICEQRVRLDGSSHATNYNTTTSFFQNWQEGNNAWEWGSTMVWGLDSCNPGGCASDRGGPIPTVTMEHYPGPFGFNDSTRSTGEQDHMQWWEGNNSVNRYYTTGNGEQVDLTSNWQNSAGVRNSDPYRVQISEYADDPNDRTDNVWAQNTAYFTQKVTPGASYTVNVNAWAPNGLNRPNSTQVQVPPATTAFLETTVSCRENITDGTNGTYKGWKALFRYKQNSYSNFGGSLVNTYETNFKIAEAVAKYNGEPTSDQMLTTINEAETLGGNHSSYTDKAAWQQLSGGNYLYTNSTAGGSSNSMSGVKVMVHGTQTNDDYYVKSAAGGAAIVRIRGHVSTNATGHDVPFGRWLGQHAGDREWSPTGGMDCPDSFNTWTPNEAKISRWAIRNLPASSGNQDPNTTGGAKWNFFNGQR